MMHEKLAGSGPASEIRIGAGLMDHLPRMLAEVAPATAFALIVPDDIQSLYGEPALSSLRAAGLRAELLAFRAGEAFKTRETWSALTDRMLELRFGRDSCVIALGGGVAGDVAGFVAATYMRGVPVVQVPTTLLAMLDASVGGKTGVDTPAGKNLVGAFHPPRLVVMDPLVLRTLPSEELRSGLAEAIKHGSILDPAYFEWIQAHAASLLAVEPSALEPLIRRSVELKAGVVAEDPLEHGRRAILNFGHTVGHALELRANYSMPHGFAVAEGMIAECVIGEHAGVTQPGTTVRLAAALRELGLPAATGSFVDLLDSMRLDKKARGAEPRFSLLARIGESARAADGGWTHLVKNDVLHTASGAVADV